MQEHCQVLGANEEKARRYIESLRAQGFSLSAFEAAAHVALFSPTNRVGVGLLK